MPVQGPTLSPKLFLVAPRNQLGIGWLCLTLLLWGTGRYPAGLGSRRASGGPSGHGRGLGPRPRSRLHSGECWRWSGGSAQIFVL